MKLPHRTPEDSISLPSGVDFRDPEQHSPWYTSQCREFYGLSIRQILGRTVSEYFNPPNVSHPREFELMDSKSRLFRDMLDRVHQR